MKASIEVLKSGNHCSFLVRRFDVRAFGAPYHYHPEYELTWIIEGEGRRFVGHNMSSYVKDDLVLIGPNIPHCWKTDLKTKKINGRAIVIQFDRAFMGNDFFEKPELKTINKMLDKSNSGLLFKGNTITSIKNDLLSIVSANSSFEKLTILLNILHKLAHVKNYALLDTANHLMWREHPGKERIHKVLAYVVEDFRNTITLAKAAGLANMTTHAFCKYYKRFTGRTFVETVIEYRLAYAVQQLVETQKPITDIGFESGFTDLSHFYKLFKRKFKVSPLVYRNHFNNR